MKLKIFVMFLSVVLTYTTNAQNYFVKNESNPRDGSSMVYMVNNYIADDLQLSAGIIETGSGNRIHILASHYTGYDRFSAQTIRLYVDSETIMLDRVVNRQRRNNHEIVGFEISDDVLRKLGNAQKVSIHLRGNWSIEKDIDRVHIRRFGEFYSKHMR